MGPPEEQPPFPIYDSFSRPGYRLMPGRKYYYPCNWLQIMENAMDPVHTAFLHTIVSGAVFTDEFGKVPELDFVETPVGMIYIATRRVGDNIWARMVETVLPNLQQVAPIWENGHQEHPFSGPMMSRWIVPMDDTNTMFIEFRHVSETEGVTPAWWADRDIMLPGQLAADTYEAGQRQPGDYEAQVSQRPIAIHGLEHLGATDRGVIMFRNQLRRGIRAVQAGQTPDGLCREAGTVIPTYCNDTIVRVPPAPTAEEDQQLMRTTGRKLAESYLATHPSQLVAERGWAKTRGARSCCSLTRRQHSPASSACARSSPTATSASANSTGAPATASRRRSTSPPRRRCTADGHAVLAGAGRGGSGRTQLTRSGFPWEHPMVAQAWTPT